MCSNTNMKTEFVDLLSNTPRNESTSLEIKHFSTAVGAKDHVNLGVEFVYRTNRHVLMGVFELVQKSPVFFPQLNLKQKL